MVKLHIFTATWCKPCESYKHIYQPHDPIIHVIDTDEDDMDLARELNIRGVPTSIMMDGEEIVRSKTGVMTRAQLKEFIDGIDL